MRCNLCVALAGLKGGPSPRSLLRVGPLPNGKGLSTKAAGEIGEVGGCDVDGDGRLAVAGAGAVLVRTRHMPGPEPEGRGGGEVVTVRRHHHAFAWVQIERLNGGEVDGRLRLVVTR